MKSVKAEGHPAELVTFVERIAAWRAAKNRWFEPMPQHLWQQACELSRYHGVGRVARAARLHYGALRARLEQAGAVADSRQAPEATPLFIELPSPQPCAGQRPGYRVVIERAEGTTMAVELPAAADVLALAGLFLGAAR